MDDEEQSYKSVCVCVQRVGTRQESPLMVSVINHSERTWANYAHTARLSTFLLAGLGAVVELGTSLPEE